MTAESWNKPKLTYDTKLSVKLIRTYTWLIFLFHQGCVSIALDKMDQHLRIIGVSGIAFGITEVKQKLNIEEWQNTWSRNQES